MAQGLGRVSRIAGPFGVYSVSDYGLKVFRSDGSVELDLTDRIARLRYTKAVGASEDDSVVLSDISGLETCHFAIITSGIWSDIPHEVSRSGTTISWTNNGYASLVIVFLYT